MEKKLHFNLIIDLREKSKFEQDKKLYEELGIEAINLDFLSAPKEVDKIDKEKSCIVICDSGILSNIIVRIMKSKGFKKVESYNGNIKSLKNKLLS